MSRVVRVAGSLLCLSLLSQVGASAGGKDIEFGANRQRFLDTADVTISLNNNTAERIEMLGGGIYSVRSGALKVRLPPEQRFLGPNDEHVWTWVSNDRVGPFEARFRTSAGKFVDRFEKGAYFTLGFDQSDASFTIWVNEKKPIDLLREDLARTQEERRIVSGIVLRGAAYNPVWSYSMGPSSIVLGDVFTEVCDASPSYVENHRRAWMGDRWCPWSSYVSFEGR